MSDARDSMVEEPEGVPGATKPSAPVPTELRTFLIADIRGYTAYTREHGDEKAAALATRFGEIVAEVTAALDGFLIELRGDEALVVFVSARKALRAAVELQERFAAEKLARGVGIGLDAGEAIPVGNGYRGTALNLAARLCAQAAAGETLASEAVIHLAAKVDGIAYVDARELKLKGYAQSVRAVVVMPTERAKGHRLASDRRGGRIAPARLFGLGAAAVALVVVAAALGSGVFDPKPSASPAASATAVANPTATGTQAPSASADPLGELPVLAFYDAVTTQLEATTPLRSPRNIAFYSGDSFWMIGITPFAFNRIDPHTHELIDVVNIPEGEANGFNFDDDYLWTTDLATSQVIRINTRTEVVDRFPFGENDDDTAPGFDIAVGDGSVWVSQPDHEVPGRGRVPVIVRMNRDTGEVEERIEVEAWGLTYGGEGLWWWRFGTLGRIDPALNEPAFQLVLSTDAPLNNIYYGGGYAWTSSNSTGRVWRVDRSGRENSVTLEPGVGEMAASKDTMWVTNANTGQLTGLDLITAERTGVIDTGHATLAVAASEDQLMVAVGPTVDEVIGELDGTVLSMATSGQVWWDPAPDPPFAWPMQARQMLRLTCLSLFNYPNRPGAEGMQLEPELANGPPEISPDGLTYKFKIRPGFKFSPPSNEEVTAETMRATLERALHPKIGEFPGPVFLGDILGAEAYHNGEADHVEGLAANGDELTITLTAPAPDLLHRLTFGMACPVPLDTGVLRSGLNPDPPISGAGPYYLADTVRRRLAVFKKNPNYPGPRPQPFDAIAVRIDTAPNVAVAMVRDGAIDAAILMDNEAVGAPLGALAQEWGPRSDNAAAGDQRWFGAPWFSVETLILNPNRPAFQDPDVRRAVSLALDRAALAEVFLQQPTSDLLSPSVEGGPAPFADVAEPNLEQARALMAGRTFDATFLEPSWWIDCAACDDFENEVVGQLAKIGITVTITEQQTDDYGAEALSEGSQIDLIEFGIGTDWPDLGAFLAGLENESWLGQARLSELERVRGLSGKERIDAARAWATDVVVDQSLIVPFGYPVFSFFISERIGCAFVQPAFTSIDLLSLCRK